MKNIKLLLASTILVTLIPITLSAEIIADWENKTVKGGKSDKKVLRLHPGTYKFALSISGSGRNINVKFKINQKNAVVGRKQLFQSKYGKGEYKGTFIVEARRLRSASGSAAAEYHQNEESTGGSANGDVDIDFATVDATREINFKLSNPVGKRRVKYSLKVYNNTQQPAETQGNRQIQVGEIERNTDRMGSDYKRLENLSNATACQTKCKEENPCVAWTFVKPNTIQGPKSQCYLKNSVPQKTTNNACESGVINR